ncbi:hypothetical protein BURC_01139 [Burkholderiaceae bacterium]|nr:hypothetical protein BURC_01139 [Burkholderiaceae bacterium]
MPVFRALLFILLIAGLLCFAMYAATGEVKWRRYGILLVKWTVFAALGFFAVLFLQRLAETL